ncbi:Uncharacterised protein [Vibrio cholerae]|nr:Uncharacterised protein [Vibrio cholerae]
MVRFTRITSFHHNAAFRTQTFADQVMVHRAYSQHGWDGGVVGVYRAVGQQNDRIAINHRIFRVLANTFQSAFELVRFIAGTKYDV